VYEVEVKFRIPDSPTVRGMLRDLGAVLLKEGVEEDIYFASRYVDFAKTDEALRLRREEHLGERWVLAYKGPRMGAFPKMREEIEAEVKDPARVAQILEKLGFMKLAEVRKKRSLYAFRDFIISVDDVEGLGQFVEIERRARTPEALEVEIDEVLRHLRLSKDQVVPQTYLELSLLRR